VESEELIVLGALGLSLALGIIPIVWIQTRGRDWPAPVRSRFVMMASVLIGLLLWLPALVVVAEPQQRVRVALGVVLGVGLAGSLIFFVSAALGRRSGRSPRARLVPLPAALVALGLLGFVLYRLLS